MTENLVVPACRKDGVCVCVCVCVCESLGSSTLFNNNIMFEIRKFLLFGREIILNQYILCTILNSRLVEILRNLRTLPAVTFNK
jgi:hypothetical protein